MVLVRTVSTLNNCGRLLLQIRLGFSCCCCCFWTTISVRFQCVFYINCNSGDGKRFAKSFHVYQSCNYNASELLLENLPVSLWSKSSHAGRVGSSGLFQFPSNWMAGTSRRLFGRILHYLANNSNHLWHNQYWAEPVNGFECKWYCSKIQTRLRRIRRRNSSRNRRNNNFTCTAAAVALLLRQILGSFKSQRDYINTISSRSSLTPLLCCVFVVVSNCRRSTAKLPDDTA